MLMVIDNHNNLFDQGSIKMEIGPVYNIKMEVYNNINIKIDV